MEWAPLCVSLLQRVQWAILLILAMVWHVGGTNSNRYLQRVVQAAGSVFVFCRMRWLTADPIAMVFIFAPTTLRLYERLFSHPLAQLIVPWALVAVKVQLVVAAHRWHKSPESSLQWARDLYDKHWGEIFVYLLLAWLDLVGSVSLWSPVSLFKLVLMQYTLTSNSSTPSRCRRFLRKRRLRTFLCLMTLIDIAVYGLLGSALSAVNALIGHSTVNLSFYYLLFWPKCLPLKEFVQLLLRTRAIIAMHSMRFKKLYYYEATSASVIVKELPAGVAATVWSIPFNSGAMRDAHYVFLQPSNTLYQIESLNQLFQRNPHGGASDLIIGKQYKPHVVKTLMKRGVNIRDQMLNDLYMHKRAQEFAALYNEHAPPKAVNFVQAAIFESEDGKLLWVEEKINGQYAKFSNNVGWVNHTRLSPHAFSHFSYHHSQHKLVVVDMQGAEKFTDPQIHSVVTLLHSVWQFFGLEEKEEFGCGNLGKAGIDLWKESHECSDLCRVLGLPPLCVRSDGVPGRRSSLNAHGRHRSSSLTDECHTPHGKAAGVVLGNGNAENVENDGRFPYRIAGWHKPSSPLSTDRMRRAESDAPSMSNTLLSLKRHSLK